MRWKLALVPLVVGFVTASCSFYPEGTRSLTLDIDRDAFTAFIQQQARTGFDCYFVSVSGAGISPDFGPLNLGSRSPQCLGLGMTSNLLSLADLTRTGTRLRVTAGASRTIRILGVNTNANGGQCAGLPLASIFGTYRPAIFEVAKATEDTFVDRRIVVSGNPSLASSSDIVAPCDNTGGAGAPPSDTSLVASGSYIALLIGSNPTQARLRTYQVGADLTLVNPVTYDVVTANPTKIYVTPNGSYLFMMKPDVGSNGMWFKRYTSNGKGDFLSTFENEQTLTEAGASMSFSSDSKFAYTNYNTQLVQRTIGAKVLETLGAGACQLPYLNNLGILSLNNLVFFLAPTDVHFFGLATRGDICGDPSAVSGGTTNRVAANNSFGRMHPSGIFYELSAPPTGSQYYLRAYKPDATGAWTSTHGSALGLSTIVPSEMILDRRRKFLALVANSNLIIQLIRLNDDGSVGLPVGNMNSTVPPFITGTFDAKSEAFYAMKSASLEGYSIDANGAIISLGTTITPAPETSFLGIQSVPVF